MIHFPLNGDAEFVVIEPGNIERLKDGRPLKVGKCLVAFTPDIEAFIKLLGVDDALPGHGEPMKKHAVHLTPEQIQDALNACRSLPEVLR